MRRRCRAPRLVGLPPGGPSGNLVWSSQSGLARSADRPSHVGNLVPNRVVAPHQPPPTCAGTGVGRPRTKKYGPQPVRTEARGCGSGCAMERAVREGDTGLHHTATTRRCLLDSEPANWFRANPMVSRDGVFEPNNQRAFRYRCRPWANTTGPRVVATRLAATPREPGCRSCQDSTGFQHPLHEFFDKSMCAAPSRTRENDHGMGGAVAATRAQASACVHSCMRAAVLHNGADSRWRTVAPATASVQPAPNSCWNQVRIR